jgi:hypothetical protein
MKYLSRDTIPLKGKPIFYIQKKYKILGKLLRYLAVPPAHHLGFSQERPWGNYPNLFKARYFYTRVQPFFIFIEKTEYPNPERDAKNSYVGAFIKEVIFLKPSFFSSKFDRKCLHGPFTKIFFHKFNILCIKNRNLCQVQSGWRSYFCRQ